MSRRLMFGLLTILAASIGYAILAVIPVTGVEAPTAEFIAAGLRSQEQACGASLQVRYTNEWQKAINGSPAGEKRVRTYRYVRTPKALRVDEQHSDGSTRAHSYDRETHEFRTLVVADPTEAPFAEVRQGLQGVFLNRAFYETVRYQLYEGPLCDRVRYGTVSPSKEAVDGFDCWRIEIPTDQDNELEKYVVWVDPAVGFNPRRIEFVWATEKPTVITFKDYALVGEAAWLPNEQVIEYSWTAKGETFRQVNRVEEMAVGRSVPDDELAVKFPRGTVVTVGDHIQYTAP